MLSHLLICENQKVTFFVHAHVDFYPGVEALAFAFAFAFAAPEKKLTSYGVSAGPVMVAFQFMISSSTGPTVHQS